MTNISWLSPRRAPSKKTAISDFDTNRKTGLIAINLKDGDELVEIKQTSR